MANQIHNPDTSTPQSLYNRPGSIEVVAVVISVLPVLAHDHFIGGSQVWI